MNWKTILGFVIGAVLLYLAIRSVNLQEVRATLENIRYPYLAAVLVMLFVNFWIRSLRWRYMLISRKKVATFSVFRTHAVRRIDAMKVHPPSRRRSFVLFDLNRH